MAGEGGGGGVERISSEEGLAGVDSGFCRRREMESRWQRSLSLFRKLIWMVWRAAAPPPLTDSVFLLFHLSL